MQATAFEYKHRYFLHGLIYTLGFAAPWRTPMWGFVQNGSTWFLLANQASKPLYAQFALYWNVILAVMVLFATAAAAWVVAGRPVGRTGVYQVGAIDVIGLVVMGLALAAVGHALLRIKAAGLAAIRG